MDGMKNFKEWKDDNLKVVTQEQFEEICKKYFSSTISGSLTSIFEHIDQTLVESIESSRYSIEVNFRTSPKETLEGFAKICLGYVSSALKKYGYHIKHVYGESPIRILVSSRNWDDGEWAGVITWHPENNSFIISKGFYNKDRKTVSIQNSKTATGKTAAEISKEIHNLMYGLKDQPNRHTEKLKPVPLKRGPKN